MVQSSEIISTTTAKFTGFLANTNWLNILGWFLFTILIIAGAIWAYKYYRDKKIYNKKITAFEIVSGEWKPCWRDYAKTVKLGRGGFEILLLKKLKAHKIAYGGRVGKDDYYFFIQPDGYWYNGTLLANINKIDESGGLIPIVTTNPLMRGQYTALEKQVDSLGGQKKDFWKEHGMAVMSIAFVLIAGIFLWLNYKEFVQAMGQLGGFIDKLDILIDKLNTLTGNIQTIPNGGGGGLVPIK